MGRTKRGFSHIFKRYKYLFAAGFVATALCMIGLLYINDVEQTKLSIAASEKLSHHEFMAEQDELARRLKQDGLASTFAYVREKIKTDTSFARECHPLLHHLGRTAFTEIGSFQVAMSQADEICNSGFIHGLIEANFTAASSVKEALDTSCPKPVDENFKEWECFHGMGHGIMYAVQKDHKKSIEMCEELQTSFAVDSCVNGVFMERFIVVSHTGADEASTEMTDIGLCRQQKPAYKSDCYYYAPTAYLERHTNKYEATFDWCVRQAETDYIATCIQGVGGQAMKENISRPTFAAELCKKTAGEYRDNCVSGAIDIFINHHASIDKASPLCTKEFRQFTSTCRETINSRKTMLKI